MPRRLSRRRHHSCQSSMFAVAAEVHSLEQRSLLTQFIPLQQFPGQPSFTAETNTHLLVAPTRFVANFEWEMTLIRKSDGQIVIQQVFPDDRPGYPRAASDDLSVLATWDNVEGEMRVTLVRINAAGTEYVRATDHVLPVPFVTFGIATSDGCWLMGYGGGSGNRVFFASATDPNDLREIPMQGTIRSLWKFSGGIVVADTTNTHHLLTSDGAIAKTWNVTGSPVAVTGSRGFFVDFQSTDRVLFAVDADTQVREELAVVPGPAAIREIPGGPDQPSGRTVFSISHEGGKLVVASDGTRQNTTRIPVNGGQPNPQHSPGVLLPNSSILYFSATASDLFRIDLTSGAVTPLPDVNRYGGNAINDLIVVGGEVWFTAQDSSGMPTLYRISGTELVAESQLAPDASPRLYDFHGTPVILDSTGFLVRATSPAVLYRVDRAAPSLPAGPADVEARYERSAGHSTLSAVWSALTGVDFYEVRVTFWNENARSFPIGWRIPGGRYSLTATQLVIPDTVLGPFGWHAVFVRGVTNSGEFTQWSGTTLPIAEALHLPADRQLVSAAGQWRLAWRNYAAASTAFDVRRDTHGKSEPVSSGFISTRSSNDAASNPFPEQSYYYYLEVPVSSDGDYTVSFTSEYVDELPETRDNSLPRRTTVLPISILGGRIIWAPTFLQTRPHGRATQFNWNGTLLPGDPGFELWIDDIGRGIPRVLRATANEHALTAELPNGQYRAWVGRRDPLTNRVNWSPATEFLVNNVPLVTAPGGTTDASRPAFRWTGRETGTFEIWLNSQTTGQRIARETTGRNFWVPAADLPEGRYLFWVRELLPGGATTDWSAPAFITRVAPPVAITGGLNAGVDQTPTLTWEATANATYELWISQRGQSSPVYRRTGLTDTTHRVASPLGNGEFTVWVRKALPNRPASLWGPGSRLSIGTAPTISASGTQLSWQPVVNATHYELWIDYEGGERDRTVRIVHVEPFFGLRYRLSDELPRGRYTAWVRAIRAESGQNYLGWWSTPVTVEVVGFEAGEPLSVEEVLMAHRHDVPPPNDILLRRRIPFLMSVAPANPGAIPSASGQSDDLILMHVMSNLATEGLSHLPAAPDARAAC